jgi:perosamine synthetase
MKIVSSKPTITRKDLEGVLDCLINDDLTTGVTVKNFEDNVGNICGLKYSLTTNSLTASYHLAYKALKIEKDDEVIMPSYFYQAPLSALLLEGGKPVIVDSDENSLFPSIETIKENITDRTKAIVVGHTFGFQQDYSELYELSVPVIEDISQAFGTEINDAPIGSGATITVASFEPTMIVTTGHGGIVMTGNSKLYSTMRDLRGNRENCIHFDYTMTDFQAAMGITQLLKLKGLLRRRREIAKHYNDAVRRTTHKAPYTFNENFAFQSFPVIFDAPGDKIVKYWRKIGIELLNPIKTPLHLLLDLRGLDFPNSDRMSKKVFSLPIYPTLTKKEIEKISRALAAFI